MRSLSFTVFMLLTVAGLAESPDFAKEVLPILSDKCFACHGPDSKKKDLRLDTYEGALEDLGGYQAINPKDLSKSEIIVRIHDKDDPMPPEDAEKHLTAKEKDILTRWVKSGGKYETHWAYVLPKKSSVHKNIDAFIEHGFSKKASFAPEADQATLARRAALVLTGLPPEPSLLDNFLKDNSANAYEKYIDRLLNNPKYGEHQARYWLDAIRYGDTHGLHLDNKRGIYPFRDWVIMAMNDNMPLNKFLTWQIAGDLLPNPNLEQLVATGFVRMNPSTSEGGVIPAEFQAKNNFDRVETIGTALLGASMLCVRCHTHKYDPIPVNEYYQLMTFFNSTAESPLDRNAYEYKPVIKAPKDIPTWKKWRSLMEAQKSGKNVDNELKNLAKSYTTTLVAKEGPPRKTYILKRGEYSLPTGDPLTPGIVSVMGDFPKNAPKNRLGLAQWLTSRKHTTVSRVLVNQIWQRVFGYGLVRTPEDFGLQGEHPTHPELLDWLAIQLHDSEWDLKGMLKMMVMTRTFKQSSRWRKDISDPENKLYARGPSFRLDAEVIRDIGLWASGLLDPHMGGEGVKPYQPTGMWLALSHPASNTKNYNQDNGNKLYRRSLYVYWKRTSPHPMMSLFDAPSRESSCVKRSRSNTPMQSLALLNETQRVEMARTLAARLPENDDKTKIFSLFKLLACREPSVAEFNACTSLLRKARERYKASPADAQKLLAIGEKKLSVDNYTEHAAWTQLTSVILASDIALLVY